MKYFLKKTVPSKKGMYLQIYESSYIKGKGGRNKSYKSLGYVSDLIAKGIDDPVKFYSTEVEKMNEALRGDDPQITDEKKEFYLGHFLLKAVEDKLKADEDIDTITRSYKASYRFSDILRTLIHAQVLSPGSKLKAFEKVIPSIYGAERYSYDQVLDAINYIGQDCHKFIEVFNKHIIGAYGERKLSTVYFDCTNYYFEIDLEDEFRKKGPSKEERHLPLVAQALMLDASGIPLDTEFFPGNESEKPYLRKRIEDMKSRNGVTGKVVQVADKGLNCARNIYAAVKEADDGYIFSKSLKGTSITAAQKEWIFREDRHCEWTDVKDVSGKLLYRYKVAKSHDTVKKEVRDWATYTYKFRENGEETVFTVDEKRILTYDPKLAARQREVIYREMEKLDNLIGYKAGLKEEIGDMAKYLNYEALDENGEKVKIVKSINKKKLEEDLSLCGYNLIVTSELDKSPDEIHRIYHNLWRIEETFRIMKSYLAARPVFCHLKETVHGHFTVCYLACTLMRLLELKEFGDAIPVSKLFDFIRDYRVVEGADGTYVNLCSPSETYMKIKEKLGLSKLGNAFLKEKDIQNILKAQL